MVRRSDSVLHTRLPVTGPQGQLVQPQALAQLPKLQRKLYHLPGVAWCLVGNGLSNQTFIEAPQGLIVVDTGECVEEMRSALREVRQHTAKPICAVIYSHFHYVNGTQAILEDKPTQPLHIYAHPGIDDNLQRSAGLAQPRYSRGLVHQFGVRLPEQGEDALLHCGLGLSYRNKAHAPFTPGYMPATTHLQDGATLNIGGLEVQFFYAPSDSDDSITLWIDSLGLCVNNLLWPALFNLYAIRGEQWRDPRLLLAGMDQIATLAPSHLIATHGPPVSDDVENYIQIYRDSIQFLWDQTVRGANAGLSLAELTHHVRLPTIFDKHPHTQQLYGVAEHHIRQIYNGLFGWFDEDASQLLPLAPADRSRRMIRGFGGRAKVRKQLHEALGKRDYRWALELGGWLLAVKPTQADREDVAEGLRGVARQTTSANLRNWCLTRALEVTGHINLDRFRQHRLDTSSLLQQSPEQTLAILGVLLNPVKAGSLNMRIGFQFIGTRRLTLHIRNQIAVLTENNSASDASLMLSQETWAGLLAGEIYLTDAIEEGTVSIEGEAEEIVAALACFDIETFQ